MARWARRSLTWLEELRLEWLSQPEVLTTQAAEWFRAHIGNLAAVAGQIGKNPGKMVIALFPGPIVLAVLLAAWREWAEYLDAKPDCGETSIGKENTS